jgi:hypothetical protein
VFECADGKQSDLYNVAMKEPTEYIGRAYIYGGDIHWTIENEELFTVPIPEDMVTDANATANHIWERRIGEYVKWDNRLEVNCETVYSLIMRQYIHSLWGNYRVHEGQSRRSIRI